MMSVVEKNGHKPEPDSAGYEKRDVAIGKLVLVTGVAVAFTVITLVVLFQYFTVETETQFQKVVLGPESVPLRELRAREEADLNTYGVIDDSLGIYRIPIERAMQLVADEHYTHPQAKTNP